MADRRLKIFHTVARLLNFTKAGEQLHMTQPAVTFQIRQLEEQFNTRLFDRTHNKVTLTEAGKQVYMYADRILKLYDDMVHSITEMTGDVSGGVSLGASTTIAEYMLPLLIGEFKIKYPDVNISLILAKESSVHVKDILKHPFICRESGSGTQEAITNYVEQHSPDSLLNVCFELSSPEAIKGAVEAGMGISIVSRASIEKEMKLGTLTAVELLPKLERPFSFVRQRYKFKSRAADELLGFAQEFCKNMS